LRTHRCCEALAIILTGGTAPKTVQLGLALALTCCLSLRALRHARIKTAGIQWASELSRFPWGSSHFTLVLSAESTPADG